MELVCVTLLTLLSLVTANPYGYGVKGGAAAKADASSAAGAFGGLGAAPLPLSIPSGTGGYSGSFSKSSSSSFASSSASSSSSAFSFSGSHGGPGLTANGITGNTKCSSGSCLTGGYEPTGSGIGGSYSGAHAAASAGAGAIIFPGSYGSHNTPCIGGDCSNNKPACDGTSCEGGSGAKKCSTSECSQASGSPTPGYGSNDIFVSTSASRQTDKSMAGSGCAYGICGPTAASSTKPSSPVTGDAYPSATASVQKPSTDLIAPIEEPCSFPNCGLPSSGSYDKDKPSSYNVPANTVYSQNKGTCTFGNCGNHEPNSQTLPTSPTSSSQTTLGSKVTPTTSQNYYPDFVPLRPTGNPSSSASTHIPPSKQPSYSHLAPSNSPVVNSAAATKTNINASPAQNLPYTGGFGGPAGILKPNELSAPPRLPTSGNYKPATPTSSASLATTETFNPSTCTSGNCAVQSFQSNLPSGSHYKPVQPTGSYKPTACVSGNCGSQSGQIESHIHKEPSGSYNPNIHNGPSGSYNPGDCSSGNCAPVSTGSYNPSTPSYKPYYPTSTSGSQNPTVCTSASCGSQPKQPTPQYVQNISYKPTGPSILSGSGSYHPTGCASGNCEIKPSQTVPQYELSGNKPISEGSYNPTSSVGSHDPTVCSSGSCGSQTDRPSSLYDHVYGQKGEPQNKPTAPTRRPDTQPLYGQNGAYTPTSPAGSYNPSESDSPTAPTAQHAQIESYKPTGFDTSSHPSFSGFNPTGSAVNPPLPQQGPSNPFYKPNRPSASYSPTSCSAGYCGSLPSQTQPGSLGSNNPAESSRPYNPSACSYGNCSPQPEQQPSQFGSSGSPYKPTVPSPSLPTGSHIHTSGSSSQFGQSSTSSGTYKPGTIVTGFGGPPGILKPNEFVAPSSQPGISSITPSGPYTPSCITGKCGPKPGYPTSQGGQYGATASHTAAGAAASANSIAYTGGFGGPPGFLQPYDGKLPIGNGPQTGSNLSSATGIHSLYGKSLSGVNLGAGATAGAAAGSYGRTSLPSGGYNSVTSGCNGGCGHGTTALGYNGTAAKSAINAGSSAGAYSGSYASSSASAHASAGAATKGGYGKR